VKGIDITRELKEGGVPTKPLFAAFFAGALASLAGLLDIHPSRIYAGLSIDGKLLLWFSVYSVILYFAFRFWMEKKGDRRPREP